MTDIGVLTTYPLTSKYIRAASACCVRSRVESTLVVATEVGNSLSDILEKMEVDDGGCWTGAWCLATVADWSTRCNERAIAIHLGYRQATSRGAK